MLQIEVSVFGGTPELVEYNELNVRTVLTAGTVEECKRAMAAEIAKRSTDALFVWDETKGVVDRTCPDKTVTPTADFVRENASEPQP